MSDTPKFKTFRDLRSVPTAWEKKKSLKASTTSSASATSTTSSANSPAAFKSDVASNKLKTEISPSRDFQKVPNSISRNLNLFRGKSKQVWDYLWSVSRGAINPVRTVRKSRKEIKEGSKLGSLVTVDAAIEHLMDIGLLKVVRAVGSSAGNEYEIFTPEEISDSSTSSTSSTRYTSLTQKLDILDILPSSISSITQTAENKGTYSDPNTSLKTKRGNDDDDSAAALAEFAEKMSAISTKLTGKKLSSREKEKWGILADLMILELESAAKKSTSISSVPAFLTEILRRKLLGGSLSPPSKKTTVKFDTVGQPDTSGAYEIKVLDQKGREEALTHLREFADEDFLPDFKKWYLDQDWQWLMENLKI